MGFADSDQFLRVTAALLQADEDDDASAVARRAVVPKATAYPILRFYRYHRAVRQARGPLKPDKRKVFQLATGLRRGHAVPDLSLRDGPEPAVLFGALGDAGVRFVIGFASAANLLAYFEPEPHATVFLRRKDAPTLKRVVGRRKGSTRVHAHYADLDELPTRRRDDVLVTEPFRTLLDVGADSSSGAHAEFLYQTLVVEGRP